MKFKYSSQFGSLESSWNGFFPSASIGWRMSSEKFWNKLLPVVNNAKFRFSVGSLGNQQVNNYAYFDQIYTDNKMSYTFDGLNKAYYASVSSPLSSSLTWETVSTYNWGLDLGFLDSKLTLTADIYIRDTKDMLTHSITLPSVFGATTPKENCADLRTNGWELYIGWQDKFKQVIWMTKIEPNENNGLVKTSSADAFQVRSLSTNRFYKKIGVIEDDILLEVHQAIAKTLNPIYIITKG